MSKKVILSTVIVLSILMLGVAAANNASAQELSSYPPLVQKIAERFNLSVGDVQSVFDEERDARRADMYAHFAEKLNDLVADGKLTETQKAAILAKHEEMQAKMEELKSLDLEVRREKMRVLHEEFKTWAQQQGIDLSLIGPNGYGFGRGFKTGHMMGMHN